MSDDIKEVYDRHDKLIDDYMWAVGETRRKHGPPPLLGTFAPKNGDVAADENGKLRMWVGTHWVP